jgi:hypothetical protein
MKAVSRVRWLIPLYILLTSFSHGVTACSGDTATGACCKVCREGKPCGDTCIAKSEACHVGGGCACQG